MQYLKDLESVVKINSYTKNKHGVDRVGLLFDTWLEDLGYTPKIHKRDTIGNHRYYLSSHDTSSKKLLLLGHLDTVFLQGTFEEYRIDEKWVYGAGVCDMKGGNIVLLEALREVKKEGLDIQNIDILFVSDEESGSDDSKYLTAELAKNYDYCFVYEAAGKNMEVVTARKGVGTFFINIEGKAAHAGNHYMDGCDANLELSYKLQELVKLTDLKKGTTVNVGKIEGGIGANTIAPHAKMVFELRYTTADERKRVLDAINHIVNTSYVSGTKSKLSGGIQRDVMQESSASLDLIEDMKRITTQEILHEARGGVSDANIVSSCGVVTLDGFGPYGDGDHTIHERANKESFLDRIDLSKKLFQYFIKHGDFKEGASNGK